MGKFLKENWLWILLPVFIVGGLLLVYVLYSLIMGDGGGGDDQPFTYTIW